MTDTYLLKCFGCGNEFSLGKYEDEAHCPVCGLRYIYDESHNPDTAALIRVLAEQRPVVLRDALDGVSHGKERTMSDCLKTLEEWNKRRLAERANERGLRNGIACPKCGSELEDRASTELPTRDPPQLGILCPVCPWVGHRLA